MKHAATALLAIAWLAGCATHSGFETEMGRWIGRSETDLVARFGTPTETATAPDGDRELTWVSRRIIHFAGDEPTSFAAPGERAPTGGIGSSVDHEGICRVTFTLRGGKAVRYAAEGNYCVG